MPIVIAALVILGLIFAFWLLGAIFSVLWMLLIGFLAGAIAKWIMPGHDGGGFLMTALLGIAGSLTAGILGRITGFYQPGHSGGFIASIVGAIILLAVYRLVAQNKTSPTH